MLKFLNKNITFQWIILLGLFGFALYKVFTCAHVSDTEGTAFLFKKFAVLFSNHEILGKCLIIIVLILQIVCIQYFFRRKEFATRNNLLPALFYFSILLITKSLTTIYPFFFTSFFFLIIICIEIAENSRKIKNNVLWAGILIALATCFDFSSIILLFLFMVTLFINQFSSIKDIGILWFGFVVFYFYLFSCIFFVDNLNEWILSFQEIKILGVMNNAIASPTQIFVAIITLSVIYLFFVVKFKLSSESKVVIQRKRVATLNTRALLLILCIFISNSAYPAALGYLSVPIAIYLAMLAQEKNPLWINEVITAITLTALLVLWL